MARMISALLEGISASSFRNHVEIRLGFLQHARDRRTRLQPLEIGRYIFMRIAERLDHVAVEQRSHRGAIGETERFPHRPGASRHLRLRSEEHTSELQSLAYLVCRLLLEKKKKKTK